MDQAFNNRNALDNYTNDFPSDQGMISIFKGEWSSKVPGYESGVTPLFIDGRTKWLEKECNGFLRKSILELGPLEGGHTYMLWEGGATSIVSIESNKKAFLKCLITKELLGYSAKFMYGDFTKYIDTTNDRYDFLLATGVLYHMIDPIRVLENICRISNRIGIWTHYFDKDILSNNLKLKEKFDMSGNRTDWRGHIIFSHRQKYNEALGWEGFCGGSAPFSVWLKKKDIISILETLGFSVKIGQEELNHPNGPAILLYAERNNISLN